MNLDLPDLHVQLQLNVSWDNTTVLYTRLRSMRLGCDLHRLTIDGRADV